MESKKTKKLLTGISAAVISLTLTGCGQQQQAYLPDQPDIDCDDLEFDHELGVWECDDYDSDFFGYYYLNGKPFKSKSALKSSSSYKTHKSSSTYKSVKSSSKSGFGSSSKGGFGG
ncbi:hypothetical protein QTG56_24885 (plasmid) [Rossellomorea sp. AcN35-11]|nr:hypothetical protein [Rossellomorea aquimaris]WJV31872.1 hypothetical protein QTG56_24885 [Rossellomorea sp. AcN35-11]